MFLEFIYYFVLFLCLCKLFAIVTKGTCKSNACLIGKTVIVTGGNSGLGFATCLNLASRGAKVIIADISNTKDPIEKIKEKTNNPNVIGMYLDLGDFSSVRKFASNILLEEERLDILINNAGCAGFNTKTNDGNYKVMQVNYLGHFLLTHLLLPKLKQTKNSRIVFVSSVLAFTHNMSSGKDMNRLANVQIPIELFNTIFDYGNSKICIIAAVKILAEKLKENGIIVSCCHPGVVKTPIYKNSFTNFASVNKTNFHFKLETVICFFIVRLFGKSIWDGIQPILYCALANNVKSGSYIIDGVDFLVPSIIKNEKFVNEVWEESIRLTKLSKSEEI